MIARQVYGAREKGIATVAVCIKERRSHVKRFVFFRFIWLIYYYYAYLAVLIFPVYELGLLGVAEGKITVLADS